MTSEGLSIAEQRHSGFVEGSTPSVQYTFDTSAASGLLDDSAKLEQLTYLSDRLLYHDYVSGGGVDDRLARVLRLRKTNELGTILVEYSQFGAGLAVIAHPSRLMWFAIA